MGGLDVISAESIYKYIYGNKERGGDLHTYLRCQKTPLQVESKNKVVALGT